MPPRDDTARASKPAAPVVNRVIEPAEASILIWTGCRQGRHGNGDVTLGAAGDLIYVRLALSAPPIGFFRAIRWPRHGRRGSRATGSLRSQTGEEGQEGGIAALSRRARVRRDAPRRQKDVCRRQSRPPARAARSKNSANVETLRPMMCNDRSRKVLETWSSAQIDGAAGDPGEWAEDAMWKSSRRRRPDAAERAIKRSARFGLTPEDLPTSIRSPGSDGRSRTAGVAR